MQKILPWQNKRLHQLIGKLKIDKEAKADLVKFYTKDREDSAANLLIHEADALIKHLEAAESQQPKQEKDYSANKMRRTIIHKLREIGFETYEGNIKKADMKGIYGLIIKIGYLKPKKLNDYTQNELPKLVSQIDSIYKKELKRING